MSEDKMTVHLRFDPRETVRKAVGGRTVAPNGLPLDPWCPRCGAPECHPVEEKKVLIRGYKVDDWSECLVCASAMAENGGGYDADLVWHDPRPEGGPMDAAWFRDGGANAAVLLHRSAAETVER